MKTLKKIIGVLLLVVFMAACSSESATSKGTLNLKAKGSYANLAGKMPSTIVLTSFKVNIRKIELELADDSGNDDNGNDDNDDSDDNDDDGVFDGDDEAELNGPWVLDLLNQTVPIITVAVPNGIYEEVEFKLSPSLVSTSALYNKTVEITGTINGTPFVLWHNFDTDFSIDYDNTAQNLIIDNGTYDLVFNFDLNLILSQLDLSSAVDGNGNGIIEIGPNDTDGNNAIAAQLDSYIEEGCDMENEDED